MIRRTAIFAVAAALTAAAIQLTGVPMASALPGLVTVNATSATDSTSSRTVAVRCPAGKNISGVGAAVNGGGGEVVLTGYYPIHGNPDSARATANEDADGYSGNWSLSVYAICVTADPSMTIVTGTSATDSVANKGAVANCPAGDETIGMGGAISGGVGQVFLTDVYPGTGLTASHAFGLEADAGYNGSWSVAAYAICIAASSTIQEVDAQIPTTEFGDTSNPKLVIARCRAGTLLHGLGARLNNSVGRETINVVQPDGMLHGVTAEAFDDEFGQPQPWTLIAIAICDT